MQLNGEIKHQTALSPEECAERLAQALTDAGAYRVKRKGLEISFPNANIKNFRPSLDLAEGKFIVGKSNDGLHVQYLASIQMAPHLFFKAVLIVLVTLTAFFTGISFFKASLFFVLFATASFCLIRITASNWLRKVVKNALAA